ncbi:hypothetical protein [Endozoicomonas sp. OPT23]|uniref:hypothetical protein n=1 Tax=Endozoicomonas sp. OPT23 TaxID=2072845 RepID=UPI00129A11CC|nr:hypothetical protein [Endozoicomonas sp. OPT23]
MNKHLKILLSLAVFSFFSQTSQALTLLEFSGMEKEKQAIYLMGVLDKEIIDASFGPERSDCVQDWGLVGAYNFLSKWYSRDPQNPNNTGFNVALLITLQVSKVCEFEPLNKK